MKTIRHNTFETNSSSTHSITIDREHYPNKQIPKTVTVEGSKFGWEHERFNDFVRKASYFWTLAQYNNDVKDRMLRLSEQHGFDLIWPVSDRGWSYETYVDHGSEHYSSWVSKHPEIATDDGLWDFLTSEAGWIMLGNDNSYPPPNWHDTPKATAAMPHTIWLVACALGDYIRGYDYALKVNTPNLKDHEEKIYEVLQKVLDDESKSYDDPYTHIERMNDDGIIEIEYYNWDYKTSKRVPVRTRKVRAVLDV